MRSARSILATIYELPNSPVRYAPMEGLRAYAALLIFAVHYFDAFARLFLGVDLNELRLASAPTAASALSYYLFASHYGVDLFFVLSGFLICRMVGSARFGYGRFLLRRVTRIYPAFLLALLVWAWVRIGVQGWYGFDALQFAGNLLFLNAVPALGIAPYAAVTWSLFHEFLFYLTFPLVMLIAGGGRPRPLQVALAGMLSVAVLYPLLGEFALRFGMLFVGALIACADDERLRRLAAALPLPLVLVAYLGSTLYFAQVLSYATFIPLFAVTAAMFVVKVMFGSGLLTRFFASTPLRYLGNVSYSFYLIHPLAVEMVMVPAAPGLAQLGPLGALALTLPLSLLLAVLLATLVFLLMERPYFAWRHAPAGTRASRGLATADQR